MLIDFVLRKSALNTAGVDHDNTPLWEQGLDGSHGEHPPQERLYPWPTGP
jgi:hypothetical protein